MEIPLVDLTAQYESIAVEIEEAIHKTVERRDFILGEGVSDFESEFAHFCGVKHCVGVGSGTDALQLAPKQAKPPHVWSLKSGENLLSRKPRKSPRPRSLGLGHDSESLL